MSKKSVLIGTLMLFFLVYGFSVGYFRIFPFNQMQTIKNYIEIRTGQFETGRQEMPANDYETLETVLNRLFLKKIPVPGYDGHGGGISPVDNWLFLISNKGAVTIFDLVSNEPV